MKRMIAVLVMIALLLMTNANAETAAATLQDLYAQAELAMAMGDYSEAAAQFDALGAYSDASQMAMYCKAITAAETLEMYDVAVSAFEALRDFKDSKQMAAYYTARGYQAAGDAVEITTASDSYLENAKYYYDKGAETYAGLALFKDCLTRMNQCQTQSNAVEAELRARSAAKQEAAYQEALKLEESGEYQQAIDAFTKIKDYKDSQVHINDCHNAILEAEYQDALALEASGEYQQAIDAFTKIKDYKDSQVHIDDCHNAILEAKYQEALDLLRQAEYQNAIIAFQNIIDYKDSREQVSVCEQKIIETSPYYRIYHNETPESIDSFVLPLNLRFGLSSDELMQALSQSGYKPKYNDNNVAKALYSGVMIDVVANVEDFNAECDITFHCDEQEKVNIAYYRFSYGNPGEPTTKKYYAEQQYAIADLWLTEHYGEAVFENNRELLILPDELTGYSTGIETELSNAVTGNKIWIISIQDGGVVAIVNTLEKIGSGYYANLRFVHFEKEYMDELLRNTVLN